MCAPIPYHPRFGTLLSQLFPFCELIVIATTSLHNITQRVTLVPLALRLYNSGILGVHTEFEYPCATFRASHCYVMRAHGT